MIERGPQATQSSSEIMRIYYPVPLTPEQFSHWEDTLERKHHRAETAPHAWGGEEEIEEYERSDLFFVRQRLLRMKKLGRNKVHLSSQNVESLFEVHEEINRPPAFDRAPAGPKEELLRAFKKAVKKGDNRPLWKKILRRH